MLEKLPVLSHATVSFVPMTTKTRNEASVTADWIRVPAMRPSDDLMKRASNLGIEIISWDQQRGAVRRCVDGKPAVGPTFMGSHDEVSAYLQAWEHLRAEKVTEQEPQVRDAMLAICTSVPIFPKQSTQITVRPQVPFRGRRVAIPDRLARHFVINDLRVGNCSQFPCSQDVPGETWAVRLHGLPVLEISTEIEQREGKEHIVVPIRVIGAETAELGRALTMTTCQPCQDIVVVVTCVDEETLRGHPFEMLIFGEEIRPSIPSLPLPIRRAWNRLNGLNGTSIDFERTPPGFGWDPDPDL